MKVTYLYFYVEQFYIKKEFLFFLQIQLPTILLTFNLFAQFLTGTVTIYRHFRLQTSTKSLFALLLYFMFILKVIVCHSNICTTYPSRLCFLIHIKFSRYF